MIMAKTKDALEVLERLTGKSANLRLDIANARVNLEVAQRVYAGPTLDYRNVNWSKSDHGSR